MGEWVKQVVKSDFKMAIRVNLEDFYFAFFFGEVAEF